jgi:hypothetical protein
MHISNTVLLYGTVSHLRFYCKFGFHRAHMRIACVRKRTAWQVTCYRRPVGAECLRRDNLDVARRPFGGSPSAICCRGCRRVTTSTSPSAGPEPVALLQVERLQVCDASDLLMLRIWQGCRSVKATGLLGLRICKASDL